MARTSRHTPSDNNPTTAPEGVSPKVVPIKVPPVDGAGGDSANSASVDDGEEQIIITPTHRTFKVSKNGVFLKEDGEAEDDKAHYTFVCGRLLILASTRGQDGTGWGRHLYWHDPDGRPHYWPMPMATLVGDAKELRARLADGGLRLDGSPRANRALAEYLRSATPQTKITVTPSVGWCGDSFVLPDVSIGKHTGEQILCQPTNNAENFLRVSGSLEAWQQHVSRFCVGNSRLILGVAIAFAGPLLRWAENDSGGVHLFSMSSTGKTSTAIVGGSVLGGGSSRGFIRSWRSTLNATETLAAAHNDLCFYPDEIAQFEAREAAEVVYMLACGSGKSRMTSERLPAPTLRWRTLIFSTGETRLADHVEEAGKKARGGMSVRVLDIPAEVEGGYGCFEDLHGIKEPGEFADTIRHSALAYYGSPLRSFLQHITDDPEEAERRFHQFRSDFVKRQNLVSSVSGEVHRAAARLASVAAAGELASSFDVTGWPEGTSLDAITSVFQAWIKARGGTGAADINNAIRQVRSFINAHGASRFQIDASSCIRDRVGYLVGDDEGRIIEYLVTRDAFRELCKGYDYKAVARALLDKGFLVRGREDAYPFTDRRTLPDGSRDRVYVILPSLLESD